MTTPDRAAAPAPLAERLSKDLNEILSIARPWPKEGPDGDWIINQLESYGWRISRASSSPLLAALDGREAWNEAIAACVAVLDEYPTDYGVISIGPTKARLRALARPQPAGEPE